MNDRIEPVRTYEYRDSAAPVSYPAVQGTGYRQVSYSNYPPAVGIFKYIQSNDESIAMLKEERKVGLREDRSPTLSREEKSLLGKQPSSKETAQ